MYARPSRDAAAAAVGAMSAPAAITAAMKPRPPLPHSALERVSSGLVQIALERTDAFFSSQDRMSRIYRLLPFRARGREPQFCVAT
jgi:hypothetical protein